MNGIAVLTLEVIGSIGLSALVLARLQGRLKRIGITDCERTGGTDFWIAYTQLMMIIAPLLLIAIFSRAGSPVVVSVAQQLKNSLLLLMCGQFAGLALVGRAVWKTLSSGRQAEPAAPGEATS